MAPGEGCERDTCSIDLPPSCGTEPPEEVGGGSTVGGVEPWLGPPLAVPGPAATRERKAGISSRISRRASRMTFRLSGVAETVRVGLVDDELPELAPPPVAISEDRETDDSSREREN